MEFVELSLLGQVKAMYDYLLGWSETHDKDDLSIVEIYNILLQGDEVYNSDGTLLKEIVL